MRPDMKKVVTERPRSGGRYKYPKGSKRYDKIDENSPKSEKIRQKWKAFGGQKEFTDVIGPLYHCLLKQVGRPWNKVYSEISELLPKGTVQNNHIHDHIWGFVERSVIMIDGIPCHGDGRFYGMAINRYSSRFVQMYVHPQTGLLCKCKPVKKKTPVSLEKYEPGIKLYPGYQLHKVNGIWCEVKVKDWYPPKNDSMWSPLWGVNDEVLGRHYTNMAEMERVYGGMYIAVSKRQLTKKEIRFNCLT